MIFSELSLSGAWLVNDDVFHDDRGAFACTWQPDEFREHGLEAGIAQCNLASNRRRNTLRGLHYQAAPFEEVKVIRAIHGAVFDVAVDLRPASPTYLRWMGVELREGDHRSLYLPRGLAHGYQTLTDNADLLYFVSARYSVAHQRGVRWDDPAFGIAWPLGAPAVINERDASYPDYHPAPILHQV